jgi:hypothetical protein
MTIRVGVSSLVVGPGRLQVGGNACSVPLAAIMGIIAIISIKHFGLHQQSKMVCGVLYWS